MNSEIKNLEQQLIDLKVKEKWEQLQNDLSKAEKKYLNKYYGSHNFHYSRLKQYKRNTLSLLHINKVYIGEIYDNTIIETFEQFKSFYDKNRLYIICEGESKTISKNRDEINITMSKTKDVPHRITGFDREIDENIYNNINTIITESIDLIFNTPIKNIPQFDCIESDHIKLLKQYGEKFIDVTNEQIYSLEGHPFLYNGKLLVNELSKQIIIDRIKEETRLDTLDIDTFFMGERIRRIGNHGKILNNLYEVLNKMD